MVGALELALGAVDGRRAVHLVGHIAAVVVAVTKRFLGHARLVVGARYRVHRVARPLPQRSARKTRRTGNTAPSGYPCRWREMRSVHKSGGRVFKLLVLVHSDTAGIPTEKISRV